MASSGSKKFFRFIILCILAGGFMLGRKYLIFIDKNKPIAPVSPEIPPAPSLIKERAETLHPPRGVFTPEELDTLFNLTTDQRAGCMHDRNYTKQKEKNVLIYSFITNPNEEGYYGYIKIFTNEESYEIGFNKKEDYLIFRNQFNKLKNLGSKGDCLDRFVLSNKCIACDMGFREDANSYKVKIMRNTKTESTLGKESWEPMVQDTQPARRILQGAPVGKKSWKPMVQDTQSVRRILQGAPVGKKSWKPMVQDTQPARRILKRVPATSTHQKK